MRVLVLLSLFVSLACSDSTDPGGTDTGSVDTGGGDTSLPDAGPEDSGAAMDAGVDMGEDTGPELPREVGGDRPAPVFAPPGYDPETPTPLLILLHGYGVTGTLQDGYFGTRRAAREKGWLLVLPDGTEDLMSPPRRFWNASSACCNFFDSDVDDVAYIRGLIEEMKEEFNVDADRVYLYGHSNGGFMSYRMACEFADEITAIASLAGAAEADTETCTPSQPVSVLQIHGTADATILYEGTSIAGRTYPSAFDSVSGYAERAGCVGPEDAGTLDFTSDIDGEETEIQAWSGCDEGLSAELWTIEGGAHIPGLADGATAAVFDWLDEHSR